MEANVLNLKKVKTELEIELVMIRQKYFRQLGIDGCESMMEEIDRKLMRMLPGYDGTISAKDAFYEVIARTASDFAKLH